MSGEKNKNIIIVEDEALIADHLEMLLKGNGYTVTGIFDKANDLLSSEQIKNASLVLLDINLEGSMDGVDIAHEINRLYQIPVIFLTSNNDKRTIERVKFTSPAGFILKPYTPEAIFSNIEIALHKHQAQSLPEKTEHKSIFVKNKNALVKILYADIDYIEAMDNYAIIYTASEKHIVPHTLKSLCDLLETEDFVKTHRSYLVNLNRISVIYPKAVLVGKREIPLSENLRQGVVSLFNTL